MTRFHPKIRVAMPVGNTLLYRCLHGADGSTQTSITLRCLHRQSALALTVVGLLMLLTGGSLWPTLMPGETLRGLLWSLLAWLPVALGVLLGMYRHLPHRRLGGANLVTLIRAGMVCLLLGMVAGNEAVASLWWPIGLATLILVLDGVDGWLARRQGLCSDFGYHFDMETDAFHVLVLCLLLVGFGKAGPWVLLGGLLRYLFIAAGLLWPALRQPLPPSLRRKTGTVVLTLSLIVALVPLVPHPYSALSAAIGVILVSLSFLLDVIWLLRNAEEEYS